MKFGVWSKPDKWITEVGYEFDEADILDAHRFIYLFFDQNAIDDHEMKRTIKGNLIYGKAIQINLSISKNSNGNLAIVPWFRGNPDSSCMTISMYCYDTIFETDITNIYSAKFILNDAIISATLNDYDSKKSMLFGENFYSKEFRNSEWKKNSLTSMIGENAPDIPDPKFYTIRHQEVVDDDLYSIHNINWVIEHEGKELYDDKTRISVMNMSLIETLESKMRKKVYDVRHQVRNSDYKLTMYDQTELSEDTFYRDFESMQHGYTYIYDSQAGINVVSNRVLSNGQVVSTGYMPFKKFQFNDKMQYDIENTLKAIKNHAKDVEKQFGSIRIHFTPLYFGDKTDVYFKDWKKDRQPTLKNKMDIDNGFKLSNEMSTISTELSLMEDCDSDDDDWS